MKAFLVFLLLCFQIGNAMAGAEIDAVKQDIQRYLDEQKKAPQRLIRYTDANGEVVRTLFQPERISRATEETAKELNPQKSLKDLMELFRPITDSYQNAFLAQHGSYDAEYLDSFEVTYRLILVNLRSLRTVDLSKINDPGSRATLERTIKLMGSLPAFLLRLLEDQVNHNAFSPEVAPKVHERIQQMHTLYLG